MQFQTKPTLSLLASAALAAIAIPAFAQSQAPVPVGTPTPVPTGSPAPGTQAAPGAQAAPGTPATPGAPAAAPAATTTISQALAQSTDHATLERLVKAAQLDATLSQPGPFTIFAPDDGAFSRLAPGTVDTLLKPANAKSLADVLKYHVVSGSIGVLDLKKQIEASGGTTTLTTLQGQTLTASEESSGALLLTDANGNKSYISKPSDAESNGVIEYVNGVLTPKLGADGAAEAGAAPGAAATPSTDGTAAPEAPAAGSATPPATGGTTPPAGDQGSSTGS